MVNFVTIELELYKLEFAAGVRGCIENNGMECRKRSALHFVGNGVRRTLLWGRFAEMTESIKIGR